MGVLHDISSLSIESKLVASGLSRDQIDRAMQHLVGRDWKRVRAGQWFKRFREKGLLTHPNEATFIFDLEALIKNWVKDHEL
jgi:SOS response regulatory protein OraA/RecX